MWPFRPSKLTDVLSAEEIRLLLGIGADLGSALSVVERAGEEGLTSIDAGPAVEGRRADPFCTYFRHGRQGGKLAFDGANEVCAQCEQRFARRLLQPAVSAPLPMTQHGTAHLRCHMGLTDYLVPVRIGGKPVAALIGGRRVEGEDDRQRIRKTVGKLGKLTRAEMESSGSDKIVIQPVDEKAREHLIHEISTIPLGSEDFEKRLLALGDMLTTFATRQHAALRCAGEDALVDGVDTSWGELPKTSAELRRHLEALLGSLREQLSLGYLVFFGLLPRELEKKTGNASLIAESGLTLNTSKRLLELDWSRLPATLLGSRMELSLGHDSVSAAINALCATRDTPEGLKDRLTKSLFFAPVELAPGLPSAVAFGPALSDVKPEGEDFRLLLRITRALARRYYALALEVERQWLNQRIDKEEEVRKQAEEARRAAETSVRQMAAARKEEERTRSFTHFDFRKLVVQCVEKVAPFAATRSIEFDARALPDRLMFDGERHRIAGAVHQILVRCVERTHPDGEGKKPAPVRVFLKRTRDGLVLGAEAMGDYLDAEERRRLFARDVSPMAKQDGGAPDHGRGPLPGKGGAEAPSSRPTQAAPAGEQGGGVAVEPAAAPDDAMALQQGGGAEAAEAPIGPGAGGDSPPRGEAAPHSEAPAAANSQEGETEAAVSGGSFTVPPTVREVLFVARRHGGRFRIDSERLRRFEKDARRWFGKTVYILELPMSSRAVAEGSVQEQGAAVRPPPPGRGTAPVSSDARAEPAPPASRAGGSSAP